MKLYKNKEWLKNEYKTKTVREIANTCNTNHQTVLRWMKKFNISRRTGKESRLGKQVINPNVDYTKPYRNKEWLINEYKTKSVNQIAKENGITKQSLLKWFKKFNIPRRNKYTCNARIKNVKYFNDIDSSIKAYWLGFLMADGANSNESLEVRLSIKDIKHLEQFKKDIKSTNAILTGKSLCSLSKYNDLYEWCHFSIHSKVMTKNLEKWGIVPNKTGEESFPNINNKYHPDFIRGYFDGDGCYTYCYRLNKEKYKTLNSSIKIVCMNYKFLLDIKNILVEQANIEDKKIHIYKSNSIWSLEICSNDSIEKFYNYIYPKYCRRYLKRKRDKFIEPLEYIKNHKK